MSWKAEYTLRVLTKPYPAFKLDTSKFETYFWIRQIVPILIAAFLFALAFTLLTFSLRMGLGL